MQKYEKKVEYPIFKHLILFFFWFCIVKTLYLHGFINEDNLSCYIKDEG